MAKRKSNAEQAAGTEFEQQQARTLLEMIVSDPKIRIHLEARRPYVPQKGDFNSISLGVCKQNQEFLDWLIEDCRRLWYSIDVRPKQGEILDGEKEAKLKAKLMGEDVAAVVCLDPGPEPGVDVDGEPPVTA